MPARLKPTRVEYVVDGVKLRSQLTAAAKTFEGDQAAQRKQAIEILRQALFRGRMIAKERLENGATGLDTVVLLSGVTDEVIRSLYDFTTVHVFRARNPTEGERMCLVAVGGYGRGTLAPFSDIDLLFLRPYKETAHTESVIEFMLYALWDLGFKVGHASRTVNECIKLSHEDFTIRTSILEARRITGDESLFGDLVRRFKAEVIKGSGVEFVTAKLAERDDRHARAGASRYLVEPNVKEGKGALRDLNTLFWIAQYLNPDTPGSQLMQLGFLDNREIVAFNRAFDFLWAVRCHLHFTTGRAEERLTFDLQPEIARRMGYGDRGDAPAVERFMKRYFLVVKEVGALTRAFCAQLETEERKNNPSGLSRFLPGRRRRMGKKPLDAPGFVIEGGRLSIAGLETFEKDPVNLLRLFQIADRRNLDLHPDAFTAVIRSLRLINNSVRRDPEAVKLFLDVLARGKQTFRTLTLMNESGVLGRFIPEWGHIVAQMQFNMYHSYTVDEHTLHAVGVIADIAAGKHESEHPLSVAVWPQIEDKEALFLAMLLHDTGKGDEAGQELGGARAARSACTRMGIEPERVTLIAWLVEHHLVMSDFAQKRDVSDPATVAAFAKIIEDPARLRLLLVLTVADIRAVGPGVWNGWKGQLMRDLYGATEAVFRGGLGADLTASVRGHQNELAEEARALLLSVDPQGSDWVTVMEDAYFAAWGPLEIQTHAALARRALAQGGAAASARILPEHNAAEITIAARDRTGLFADLASAIAAMGGDIVGARVYTSRSGQALDVFYVQDASGAPFGDREASPLHRLIRTLENAARDGFTVSESRRASEMARTAAFAVTPSVLIDNDASPDATILEVSGRDRPGLLGELARALSENGLSIASAHIDNYGERAVDAFYVHAESGAKADDPKRVRSLRKALIEVLEKEDIPAASRLRLQRARASSAR